MNRFFPVILSLGIASSLISPLKADAFEYNPNFLVSDQEMLDVGSMNTEGIQTFLERGALASIETSDYLGRSKRAAEIIFDAASQFRLSARFLLTLLQREQSLVEDDDPTQNQLDWAMGYAICDDCEKEDPRLQKFKGFGNQVHHAAKRIRESYLTDLETRGETLTGIGPNKPVEIDKTIVVPANKATSVLYTYTPHLHGNKNFFKIWQKWFKQEYLSGSLLQSTQDESIWLIQDGKRRPITSRLVFESRFGERRLTPIEKERLDLYPVGDPIQYPNYSLVRSPLGTVYLLVDDKKRGFISMEIFKQIGFNTDEIIDASFEDLAAYEEALPITSAENRPKGSLLQDPATGGVFYVENGNKHPIFSIEILTSRFPNKTIETAKPEELEAYPVSDPVRVMDGTLIGLKGSPEVFVVADGERHHISDEATFLAYNWNFLDVVWMNERSVLVHPLGDPVTSTLGTSNVLIATP